MKVSSSNVSTAVTKYPTAQLPQPDIEISPAGSDSLGVEEVEDQSTLSFQSVNSHFVHRDQCEWCPFDLHVCQVRHGSLDSLIETFGLKDWPRDETH
ncbi:hypothetical protein RRG08_015294 [Elysia crispata]|uniref:Uncharacterized protein n=1 Tax=Elysia crispata TaxID=231223 RepID=A0AAE0ZU60_9GAST|nr:hypothetical protein RRG08_015294 [Elysia crispata]